VATLRTEAKKIFYQGSRGFRAYRASVRDVKPPRRWWAYVLRRSNAREVWVAYRGTRVVSRYGFPKLRKFFP
jgi:hypothetical protein